MEEGSVCPIFKKGDQLECRNYRGITLLNTAYKIFSNLLFARLQSYTDKVIRNYQCGFRPQRSTIDQIHTLKQILEKTKEYNIKTFNLFVDFKAAYDSINRDKMIEAMTEFKIPQKFVNLTKATLKNVRCRIKIQKYLFEPFTTERTLHQGDSLACLLFNLVLEKCIRDSGLDRSGTLWNRSLQLLAYADDIDIIGRSEKAVKEAFQALEISATNMGLTINEDKTKFMETLPSSVNNTSFCVNGHSFERFYFNLKIVKSIAKKRKRQFYGNKFTNTSKNNSTSAVPECTASCSKLGKESFSTAEEMPGPVFGNRIVDLELIVEAFAQLCCPKCFAEKVELFEDSRYGLCSHFTLKCKCCDFILHLLHQKKFRWQRRGYTSMNGCVAAISVDTGKVLDIEVICRPTVQHIKDVGVLDIIFELYRLYKEPQVTQVIRSNRLRWLGHIWRSPENNQTRAYTFKNPMGSRTIGKTTNKVDIDDVENDLKTLNIKNRQRVAAYRWNWRKRAVEAAKTCNRSLRL
ncbi:reverse transcriptase domain-containing protein [Trichonephila clavipes]|nr:reverse transcriptase domain-containing protein [Trichonephila clavipes]